MTCEKCGGTGLVPFVLPDGSKSRYAQSFCECSQNDYRGGKRPACLTCYHLTKKVSCACRDKNDVLPESAYCPDWTAKT